MALGQAARLGTAPQNPSTLLSELRGVLEALAPLPGARRSASVRPDALLRALRYHALREPCPAAGEAQRSALEAGRQGRAFAGLPASHYLRSSISHRYCMHITSPAVGH